VLKHCAANRKRRLSALPNVVPYIYDVKNFWLYKELHIYIYIYIYDISRLRVNYTPDDGHIGVRNMWRQ
jgi:hypothetical protein